MAYNDPAPGSLKRKRRRRADKPPIAARLQLDDKLKGEYGLLSADLVDDLFPGSNATSEDHIYYIAVSQYKPISDGPLTSSQWTVVPCRRGGDSTPELPHSTVRVPTEALCAQSLLNSLQSLSTGRGARWISSIEVRIVDVQPLPLDTIYVSVDGEALRKIEEVQQKFGGGFPGYKNGTRRSSSRGRGSKNKDTGSGTLSVRTQQEAVQVVKTAFRNLHVVHSGDAIRLNLPTHPITHAAPPSATVTGCEPVSQGSIGASTRVVLVVKDGTHEHRGKPFPVFRQQPVDTVAEVEEETSNEAFFTAAEDGPGFMTAAQSDEDSASDALGPEGSEIEDDNLSDDSDEMISLSSPALGSQVSGVMSSLTAATPRPFGRHTNGISTPGSTYSAMTSNTVRGGQPGQSKLFQTQGLLERISEELLHPKPGSDDDEEARVYVDTVALAKLGCFSGDWVTVEAAEPPSHGGLAGLGLSMFGEHTPEDNNSRRPVKVFGLPESMSTPQARYPLHQGTGRRDSISSVRTVATTPAILHASPVLLANLGDPSHLRVSTLSRPAAPTGPRAVPQRNRITSSSTPPLAKEVTLLRVSTPLSTETALQPSLFTALREYFEDKSRVVKSGDLLAIPIDVSLGRAIFEGGAADEDVSNSDLLSTSVSPAKDGSRSTAPGNIGVAWFQIGGVTGPSQDDEQDPSDVDIWNGVVSIDPTATRMSQSGVEQRRLPSCMGNVWPYYHGLLRAPPRSSSSKTGLITPPKPFVSQLQRRLRGLISAATSARATHLALPPLAILLTSNQRSVGKSYTASMACLDLGIHFFPIDAYDILSASASGGGDVKTETILRMRAERALSCGSQNTVVLVRHIEALNSDRMSTALKEILSDCRTLIATTTEVDKVPDMVRGLFTHELEMSAPDEAEREGILRSIIANSGFSLSPSVDLASVAIKTAALVAGDLIDVVDRAVLSYTTRLENLASSASSATDQLVTLRDIQLSGGDSAVSLTPADFDSAVDDARKNFADSIGAPKIPNVQWSDVGGLANVKEAVIETIQLPLSRPELFAKGLKKRSGILFYGPPGTGKTLLAKAIATEFSLNFFSVKGPELLNMYIGESEANVRRVFQKARDARPCVVFFDELDSVAPKRGNQGDSGGVMDRIVSQLLAELDGMSDGDEGGGGVFVIGATNRPDLLDQALLRPGRFDKMLYLGVSDTHEKQQKILEALTRK